MDDVRPPDVEVWPDNAVALGVFVQMETQWRVGMGGPVGLDYTALRIVMRMNRIPPDEQSELFEAVRVMERAALDEMNEE
ncbi:DUF1799 domain-containing protein [Cupriavidus pauculus]|uniref:DUF1799 domain-containing protein n=1 Tax=Cupriavidus pauculus TaxID=82633 RepID=UPI0030FA4DCC